MPRFMPMYLRRLLQDDGRRRRFIARHRRHGFGECRRFDGQRYGLGRFLGRSHGSGRLRGQGNYYQSAATPANDVTPLPMPSTPLAPQALEGDENADQAPVASPPGFWCSTHGWVICPLHEYGPVVGMDDVGQSPTSVFDFGSTRAVVVDANVVAPRLLPPTPAVNGASGSSSAAADGARTGTSSSSGFTVVDVNTAATPLPSPTPATLPPSPRTGASHRLVALGLPPPSSPAAPPSSSRGRRTGSWSPAALVLANGASNSVVPGTQLPGGSSDEDERGGSASHHR